jgi:type IV fimbrial biogenesis protein FimT
MIKEDGFSLIEVIVTMAIAAIVLTLGVPSFQSFIQNNRQSTAISELATSLQLARNSAISRRVRVTVCKSADGLSCTADGNASDWSQGWIVFADPNNRDTVDVGEDILRAHGALDGTARISGNRAVVNRIAFKPQGLADGSVGTLTYCDNRGDASASALIISFGGQVRNSNAGDSLSC